MAQRIVAQELWQGTFRGDIQDVLKELSTNPTIKQLKEQLEKLKTESPDESPNATAGLLVGIFLNKTEYNLQQLDNESLLQRARSSVQNALQKNTVAALEKECTLPTALFILKWQQSPGYRKKVTSDISKIETLIQELKKIKFPIPKRIEETTTLSSQAQHETEAKQAEEETFSVDEEAAIQGNASLSNLNSDILSLEEDLKGGKDSLRIAQTIAGILLTNTEHSLGSDKPQSLLIRAETVAEATGTFGQTAFKKLKNKLVKLFAEFETKWASDQTIRASGRKAVDEIIQLAKPKIAALSAMPTHSSTVDQ